MFQGRNGVANANFREREESEYEEVQVEARNVTRRSTNSLENPTSSGKIGVKVSFESTEDEDIINHSYVNTEFGPTGLRERGPREEIYEDREGAGVTDIYTSTEKMIESSIDQAEEFKGPAKADMYRSLEFTEGADTVSNHSYENIMFGRNSTGAIDWTGGCSEGAREADGLDFTCAFDDGSVGRESSEYHVSDSSFIENMGIRVENAIKDIVLEKRVGMSRVNNALQDIGNGIRNEKEEVYDMLARVHGLQDSSEKTPRRSSRLAKKRLNKENRP